ncbi:cytochrome b/b6 domain-containing protein [Dyella sp. BiH032]|uniref:cytochrome b n=1 Tax=Dyella sp. BiH032 TaxID=3075430 RepID=UPI0028934011|nr:cytochrome b/b6 domain-containing protein [Dyella sp. BiH032]WNL44375.1 cytochrome b/b6 domain-containing protein [Dyella sp. BiH032]
MDEDNTRGVVVEVESAPVDRAEGGAPVCRPRSMRLLHWITAACVIVVAALALIRDETAGRVARQWLLEGHRHGGLLVLALVLVRLGLRVRFGKLPHVVHSRLLRAAAVLTHAALYAALLAMPLIGWALSNAEDKPVHLFGLTLPALVADDEDLADRLLVWHQDVAWVLLALVSLHVAAALWHHFVRRDGVLRSMWPARRR